MEGNWCYCLGIDFGDIFPMDFNSAFAIITSTKIG